MTLKLVHDLQKNIHDFIAEIPVFIKYINKIHLNIEQDSKYPFLLIRIDKIGNSSKPSEFIYNIDFTIAIFVKNNQYKLLLTIADEISQKLSSLAKINFMQYIVASIKMQEILFCAAKDLVSSKAEIKFSTVIKKRYSFES